MNAEIVEKMKKWTIVTLTRFAEKQEAEAATATGRKAEILRVEAAHARAEIASRTNTASGISAEDLKVFSAPLHQFMLTDAEKAKVAILNPARTLDQASSGKAIEDQSAGLASMPKQVSEKLLNFTVEEVYEGTEEELRWIGDALGDSRLAEFNLELKPDPNGLQANYGFTDSQTSEQNPCVTGVVEFSTQNLGANRREQLEEHCQTLGHLRPIIADVTAQLSCGVVSVYCGGAGTGSTQPFRSNTDLHIGAVTRQFDDFRAHYSGSVVRQVGIVERFYRKTIEQGICNRHSAKKIAANIRSGEDALIDTWFRSDIIETSVIHDITTR
jgi:hypothetical protein